MHVSDLDRWVQLFPDLFHLLETAHIPWYVAPSIFKATSGHLNLPHTASL
jgi:hypothetical protein